MTATSPTDIFTITNDLSSDSGSAEFRNKVKLDRMARLTKKKDSIIPSKWFLYTRLELQHNRSNTIKVIIIATRYSEGFPLVLQANVTNSTI